MLINLFYLLSVASAETASPSVWEQMRLNGVNRVEVTIESVEVTGSEVIVTYKEKDMVLKTQLCREVKNEPYYGATFQNQRVEMLRSALNHHDKVELTLSGPFNPCLQSVKVNKAE